MELAKQTKHFVLVHGACHGAWCWYKLKPKLEKSGYRVTTPDMAASGINMKPLDELDTFNDYTEPLLELMASLPEHEKVILVGHSLGGLNLAVAMENFPEKISVAVFLTAIMPDTTHLQPSHVMEKYMASGPEEGWSDIKFTPRGDSKESPTELLFGPKSLSMLYEQSPAEDLQLAMMLARPTSLFLHNLSRTTHISNQRYGSVRRVYIICKKDKAIPENFQRWMTENGGGVHEVKELIKADHMPMCSVPQELHDCLVEIADKSA